MNQALGSVRMVKNCAASGSILTPSVTVFQHKELSAGQQITFISPSYQYSAVMSYLAYSPKCFLMSIYCYWLFTIYNKFYDDSTNSRALIG